MDDETHTYWTGYVRLLADALGLKDWGVTVNRDAPDNPIAAASMACVTGRKIVHICLRASVFLTSSCEEQRHYVLHELVHVHLDDVDTVMCQVEDVIDGDMYKLLKRVVDDRIEFAVDAIAAAIGPFFPLPELP